MLKVLAQRGLVDALNSVSVGSNGLRLLSSHLGLGEWGKDSCIRPLSFWSLEPGNGGIAPQGRPLFLPYSLHNMHVLISRLASWRRQDFLARVWLPERDDYKRRLSVSSAN